MKKIYVSYCLLACTSFGLVGNSHADISLDDIELSGSAQYVLRGSYEPSYDVLIGGEIKYNFFKKGEWNHFVKAGMTGNIETSDSKLTIYDFGVGSRYQFAKAWNKSVYVDYSLGAAYHIEEFSFQLSDGVRNSSFNTWEYQAGIGLGMDFNKNLSSRLFVNQLGTQGTSMGLDIAYKF